MSLVQRLRGGRDNHPKFGSRMRGTGTYADLIARRFTLAKKRYGFDDHRAAPLDTSKFRPLVVAKRAPPARPRDDRQLDLI